MFNFKKKMKDELNKMLLALSETFCEVVLRTEEGEPVASISINDKEKFHQYLENPKGFRYSGFYWNQNKKDGFKNFLKDGEKDEHGQV